MVECVALAMVVQFQILHMRRKPQPWRPLVVYIVLKDSRNLLSIELGSVPR